MFDGDAALHDVSHEGRVGSEMGGIGYKFVFRYVVIRSPGGGVGDNGEPGGCIRGRRVVYSSWCWGCRGAGGEGGEGVNAVSGGLGGGDWVFDHVGDDWTFFF